MKNRIFNAVQVSKGKFAVVAGTAVASMSPAAFADNTTAVTDAITAGTSMVSLTTSGVISVAAICFGVGLVVSWLRK